MSGVAEMHGVWAPKKETTAGQWVKVAEIGTDRIEVSYPLTSAPLLTAEGARYLGLKLLRLSRRMKEKTGA